MALPIDTHLLRLLDCDLPIADELNNSCWRVKKQSLLKTGSLAIKQEEPFS